ncbi:TonB-dependent receptor domain-containing protein [Sphingobium sp. R-21]|uniref:TonB-dependent receptor domain-containing protein n=1 Tax=Sphingobium sp. R-21 TaxID=3404056 RepID=UPI003CE68350
MLTGEQRTRGVEAEVAWRPAPGIEFTGAFTYLDAIATADNRLRVGSRLGSIPHVIANFWSRYTIQDGLLANLGAGLGLHHEGSRMASTALAVTGAAAPFALKAYTLVDGALVRSRRSAFS